MLPLDDYIAKNNTDLSDIIPVSYTHLYRVSNFTDNDDVKTLDQKGPFTVIEYQRDLSVTPGSACLLYTSRCV